MPPPSSAPAPKDARQGLQQVGHPSGWHDGDAVGLKSSPGDAGAVDGDDRGNLEVGDAEDLVGLVGLPSDPAQGQTSRWRPCQTIP
jgi:hypothetical protein